jgi:hypothetical protein
MTTKIDMKIEQKICERLKELSESPPQVKETFHQNTSRSPLYRNRGVSEYASYDVNSEQASQWGISCLNILEKAFGNESSHYIHFKDNYKDFPFHHNVRKAIGIMKAAFDDYSQGFAFNLRTVISGEIFQDFVELAKRALAEGNKDVAAVLACSALEDTLKRYAKNKGLAVDDKDMTDVVAALKSQGLVSGAQKTLLSTMPKIRNYAMHANWDKITEPDVNSVIGFVEQFLITYF